MEGLNRGENSATKNEGDALALYLSPKAVADET